MSASDTPMTDTGYLAMEYALKETQQQLTAARESIINLSGEITAANAKLEEQAVRLREAERDAERYRWLRRGENKWSSGLFIGMQTATAISQFTDEIADKTIDAARSKS